MTPLCPHQKIFVPFYDIYHTTYDRINFQTMSITRIMDFSMLSFYDKIKIIQFSSAYAQYKELLLENKPKKRKRNKMVRFL